MRAGFPDQRLEIDRGLGPAVREPAADGFLEHDFLAAARVDEDAKLDRSGERRRVVEARDAERDVQARVFGNVHRELETGRHRGNESVARLDPVHRDPRGEASVLAKQSEPDLVELGPRIRDFTREGNALRGRGLRIDSSREGGRREPPDSTSMPSMPSIRWSVV